MIDVHISMRKKRLIELKKQIGEKGVILTSDQKIYFFVLNKGGSMRRQKIFQSPFKTLDLVELH